MGSEPDSPAFRWKKCEEKRMLFLVSYLAAAALFYTVVAKRAPVMEESTFDHAGQDTPCEVVELFASQSDRTASRAA